MDVQHVPDTLDRYKTSELAWPSWQLKAEQHSIDRLIEALENVADTHERHAQGKTLLRNLYFKAWKGKNIDTIVACGESLVRHCQHAAQTEEAAKEWWLEEAARVCMQVSRFLAIGWNDGLSRSFKSYSAGKSFGQRSLQLRLKSKSRLRDLAECYFYLSLHEACLSDFNSAVEYMSEALSRFIEVEMKSNRPTALAATSQLDLILCFALLSFLDRDETDDHTLTQAWQRLKAVENEGVPKLDAEDTISRLTTIILALGGKVVA